MNLMIVYILKKDLKVRSRNRLYSWVQMGVNHDYQYIFEMDADFSHNPDDLIKLYNAL